jgi:hypothetical protein
LSVSSSNSSGSNGGNVTFVTLHALPSQDLSAWGSNIDVYKRGGQVKILWTEVISLDYGWPSLKIYFLCFVNFSFEESLHLNVRHGYEGVLYWTTFSESWTTYIAT